MYTIAPTRTRLIACISAGVVLVGSIAVAIFLVRALTRPFVGTSDIEAAVAGQILLVILGPALAFNIVGSTTVLANVRWGPPILRIGLLVTATYAAAFISILVLSDLAAGQPLAPSFLRGQLVTCAIHGALGAAAFFFASFLRRGQVLRPGSVPNTA